MGDGWSSFLGLMEEVEEREAKERGGAKRGDRGDRDFRRGKEKKFYSRKEGRFYLYSEE